MKKNLVLLSLLVSVSAFADNVTVYLAGQEIAGSDKPTAFNVVGDNVEVSSPEFKAFIYKEKNQTGVFATVEEGEKTPFSFRSIDIQKIPTPLEGNGLFFEVKSGTPCVNLAVELLAPTGAVSLYKETDVTYSLPEYNQSETRKFKKLCSTDGVLDANALAIAKVGLEATIKQKVRFIAFSERAASHPTYNYILTGHLPKWVGDNGEFTPDHGLDYMGNFNSWRRILSLKTKSHIVSGR